jgi:adenylosuccinate lyase
MADHSSLLAITPLDGRYSEQTQALSQIVSEYGLIKRRLAVEVTWFSLLGSGMLADFEALSEEDRDYLKQLVEAFTVDQAAEIKAIEKKTNHDVKAVEIWLRNQLASHESLKAKLEYIHFGITSEDINNIAYALQVRDSKQDVLRPAMDKVSAQLNTAANEYAAIPMLARTHGQPATPTTLGKEIRVFQQRLERGISRLEQVTMLAKFNGATGNYNALAIVYPEIDWPVTTAKLVEAFGFSQNELTTQIESHDWLAAYCSELALINTILTDLSRDIWLYISFGYFSQELKKDEVGSSTMPHKINPINFENAEANFGVSSALLTYLASKLPISRLQRDLSDSASLRSLSEAFGHCYIGLQSLLTGLSKIKADPQIIATDLEAEWSVLAEAVQTIMRRYGTENAYDKIKQATRGKALDHDSYITLVESLDLPATDKQFLLNLTPQTYVGYASRLASK